MNADRRRLICVSLAARTTGEALAGMDRIANRADIAELRLDLMAEYDLARLIRNRPCPVIVTHRPVRQGGRFAGDEAERVAQLAEAVELGAELVDVEPDSAHLIKHRRSTRLIVSHHDFAGLPADPAGLHRDLAGAGADVVKVAGLARRVEDNLTFLALLEQARLPTIAVPMGEPGTLGRILCLRYPSCLLTYAALDRDAAVAPGQLSVGTMREVYQAHRIGSRTVVHGVLSTVPVAEALLTALNGATRDAGQDGVWVPLVCAPKEAAGVVDAFRRVGVAGYLVTEPLQEAIRPAVDRTLSPHGGSRLDAVHRVKEDLVGIGMPRAAALLRGSLDLAPAVIRELATRGWDET